MRYFTLKFIIGCFLSLFVLSGCAVKINDLTSYPVHFEAASHQLGIHLLQKIKQNEGAKLGQTNIAIDPFVDINTGTVVNASREIERIIVEESKQYKHFVFRRLSTENLREAHYIINGILDLEEYKVGDSGRDKYYHIKASVTDLQQGKVIANASMWLLEADLDYAANSIHKDNPFYLKDDHFEEAVKSATRPVGELVNEKYYNFLDTDALLVEAETLYEKKEYETALLLFKQAAERKDGKILRTYAGLYETYVKLGNDKEAESAFDTLLSLNIQENKKLNLKLLFAVNSVNFIENTDLKKRYDMWLQHISHYFQKNALCFHIVGHTSKTGSKHYNDKLSLERARAVQSVMIANFPDIKQRSKVIGKGFSENVVGSGTDDARDAVDRRVEFIIIDCPDF